jgi:lipoprotein-anchoring transpeptidase ErfK/SrfK
MSDVRPITGEATVLPVLAHATGPRGASWLQVLLPGRPNSSTGWILRNAVFLSITKWQIVVTLSLRRVQVFWGGHLIATFSAVVGSPSTPTPTGHFFVEEDVLLYSWTAGAPYALALSARSNVYSEFEGGPGQIAMHGTANIGGDLGSAESHGCIRLDTTDITWLAPRIQPGTPVTINP